MPPLKIRPRIEVELSGVGGGWTDLGTDVDDEAGFSASRGILSHRVDAFVEETPEMTFTLNNSAKNSGGLAGYYSLLHTNTRSGWDLGIRCRLVVKVMSVEGWISGWISGWVEQQNVEDVVCWTGEIRKVTPTPGKHLDRRVRVQALGWTDHLAKHKLKSVAAIQGVSEHDAVQAIYDEMPVSPPGLTVHPGTDGYDVVFDLASDGALSPLSELQRICQSSLRYDYSLGDGTKVNEARSVSRAQDGNPLTVDIALTEADLDRNNLPTIITEQDQVPNLVKLSLSPRRIDSSAVVLYSLSAAIRIDPGATVTIAAKYRDPSELGITAGGVNPVTPASGIDYIFNSLPDGTGTDLTSSVTTTYTFASTQAEIEMTNGAAVAAWATTLQVRAIGIYSQEQITLEARDQTAINADGENLVAFNMPYQSEPAIAQAVADWIEDKRGSLQAIPTRVPLLLSYLRPSRALDLLQTDISSIFSMVETMTGLDGTERFHINGIRYEWRNKQLSLVWYGVPAYEGFEVAFPSQHLTTGGDGYPIGNDITSIDTASIDPDGDTLVLAWVAQVYDGGTAPAAPTLSGNSLTWVQVATVTYQTSGGYRGRLTLFRAMKPSPTAGAVTITTPAVAMVSWSISQFGGVDTGGTDGSAAVVQSATNSAMNQTSLTVTLAAFGAGTNRPAAGFAHWWTEDMAAEAGWTLLGKRYWRAAMLSQWEPDSADTTATVSTPAAYGGVGGIAVELKMT